MYCNLPALGGDSAYSTILPSLHTCVAPTSSRAHGTHVTPAAQPDRSLTHIDWPTGRSVWSSNSPRHSIRRLHYHLDMLPFWERIRSTKEGTTRTVGWITPFGSKAGRITGGELRRTKGYLGKIPCIKESLYPRKKDNLPLLFPLCSHLKAILENTLTG